jgi:hypothetical protein
MSLRKKAAWLRRWLMSWLKLWRRRLKMAKKTPLERTYTIEAEVRAYTIEAEEQPRAVYPEQQAIEPYFRASMHTEQQKFRLETESRQLMLGEETASLDTISYGLDLTESQDRALHAIQKLLADTNYQGDGQINLSSADFKIYGSFLPYLSLSYSDYYQAYGLPPAGDGRYHGAQVKQAREALESLTELRWMRYKKLSGKYKDGKPLYDLITVKKPLIQLQFIDSYRDLTEEDIESVIAGQELSEDKQAGRVTRILLLPSPILIDEIDSFYLLKPTGLHDEIKALYPGKRISRYNSLFIEYLLTVDISVMKIGKETLARVLNMDALIADRQKARIDKRIQEVLKTAKELGYLLDYEEQPTGLMILRLNPDRCSRVRAKLARKKRVKDKETG